MSKSQLDECHSALNATFATGRTKAVKWRKWQLKQLWWMLEQNTERFIDALNMDLHRHPFESLMMDLGGVKGDIINALGKVDEWSKGDKPDAGFLFGTLGGAWLRKEPLGVALIIAAWNFPFYTLLSPVVGAIVAGNCVVMKPSELAPACQDLLVELVPKYMDTSAIRVLTGGPEETSKMLELKWNHIFYTGGGKVGRLIAAAGAKHLTPVALELGGQSPVIVTASANIDLAAKRIANAKLTNVGQVCLNANHVFADPAIYDKLIDRLIHWNKQFTKDGEEGFAHIINERHFDRITNLLKSSTGEVVFGGATDRATKYIQPTIVKDVSIGDSLLSEELFAPIAPVIAADMLTAIRTINSMPHPLGLYIFSSKQEEIDSIINSTTSGGVTVNDVALHAAVPNAPFGGVGESGYGSYHGKFGFDAFSHTRTVVSPPNWLDSVMGFRYPPFKVANAKLMTPKGGKLVGKPGETMEEQKVGTPMSATKVLGGALLIAAVLAAVDSASGGRFLFLHTIQDVLARLGWKR